MSGVSGIHVLGNSAGDLVKAGYKFLGKNNAGQRVFKMASKNEKLASFRFTDDAGNILDKSMNRAVTKNGSQWVKDSNGHIEYIYRHEKDVFGKDKLDHTSITSDNKMLDLFVNTKNNTIYDMKANLFKDGHFVNGKILDSHSNSRKLFSSISDIFKNLAK